MAACVQATTGNVDRFKRLNMLSEENPFKTRVVYICKGDPG